MASTTAIMRSAGAPGTAVADWKAVTVERFAGFIQASVLRTQALIARVCARPCRREPCNADTDTERGLRRALLRLHGMGDGGVNMCMTRAAQWQWPRMH